MAVRRDEGIGHAPRILGGIGDRLRLERNAILLAGLAQDGDRPLRQLARESSLHRGGAGGTSLLLVRLRRHARERALEIAKRVRTNTRNAGIRLEMLRQRIAERPRAGELEIAVRILLAIRETRGDRRSIGLANALGNRHHAPTVLLHRLLDVFDEAIQRERTFRQIDEMGAVVLVGARQRGRGRQEARVATHDDIDLDAAQRPVVQIVALERTRDKPRRRAKAGGMVARTQIIVDRLGDMVADERVAFLLSLFGDDPRRIGRVIPANIEEIADFLLLESRKDRLAVLGRRFFPNRAQRRTRRRGNGIQLGRRRFAEIDIVVSEDPGDAMTGAEDLADLLGSTGGQNGADEGLVDDHRRSAGLGDDHICKSFFLHGAYYTIVFFSPNSRFFAIISVPISH